MNILTRLRLERGGLTEAERALADVILTDPARCLTDGAKQLAARALVSQATVYRLCEKLGCTGLADLRVRLAGALESFRHENAGVDVNFPVGPGQDGRAVIDGLARDLAQTLAATANVLDAAALDRAAELVLAAERVDVLATAGNVAFAQNFRFQMAEVGRAVNVPVDEYEQRLAVASADPTHAVVLVSFGGRGAIARPAARSLAERGVPVVLVASAEPTPLDEYARVKLALSPQENHARKVSPFATGLSLLFVLDALFARCFVEDFDANLARRLAYYEGIVSLGGCSGGRR
ncbi:MurR/RpiR family transcriptional regulator [Thermophilibacter sp.]